MECSNVQSYATQETKILTAEELQGLSIQDSRKVNEYTATILENNSKKHWDLFYKRNETRFFKDRHWTTREFQELLDETNNLPRTLFEIGCGVGNFIFPLVEEGLNFKILACDISPRAIEMLRNNPSYNADSMKVFPCDITTKEVFKDIDKGSVDIATLIFVLSAIHPNKFLNVLENIFELLKPGGLLLLRDYGLYDMAQLRFKPGHKIADNLYMRQDGTTSYYFSIDFLDHLFKEAGFNIITNTYIHKRTINRKENINVPRIFIQYKVERPKINCDNS